MIEQYHRIISQMDQAGKERRPFLFVLDYEKSQGAIVLDPLDQQEVLFKMGAISNIQERASVVPQTPLEIHPESQERYARRFDVIQKGMASGASVLANLTVCTPIDTPLSLKEILLGTKAKYQILFPEGQFVCFSPERFVAISREGIISTDPMKGTITDEEPGAPEVILNNYKETSEHCAVVDLLRSDLSRVADRVEVSRFRYFTEIATPDHTIYQVSSEIKGALAQGWQGRIGTIIDQLLPAGSILGAPRESTRRLIAEAEGKDTRGFYCGVFGYFDGEKMDSSVLIRFIREDETGRKYYHSGGGVTVNSTMEQEYREVINKIYLPLQ
ncbi:MAG: aminodeoxychorismate synthase component I [Porphyromonas sp.]|nr:aminodeoxychorismate synthase component I [Porphyromonas sp.]